MQKLKNEPRPKFTGSYKKKSVYHNNNNNNNNSLFDSSMKNTIRKNTISKNIIFRKQIKVQAVQKNHQGLSELDDLSLELCS